MTPALHITFTDAGADALSEALRLAGRADRVISLPDDLSFGPVAPADPGRRTAWARAQGFGDGPAADADAFWREALADAPTKVVWTNRRVAREYAGFLEWLSRNGAAPFGLIDLTHVETPSSGLAVLGLAEAEVILAAGWLDRARPLSAAARRDLVRLWKGLAGAEVELRTVRDGDLVAAPLSLFDDALLAASSPYWMRLALVIGTVQAEAMHRGEYNAGLSLLEARVCALVDAGRLEAEGEGGACQIRRPDDLASSPKSRQIVVPRPRSDP